MCKLFSWLSFFADQIKGKLYRLLFQSANGPVYQSFGSNINSSFGALTSTLGRLLSFSALINASMVPAGWHVRGYFSYNSSSLTSLSHNITKFLEQNTLQRHCNKFDGKAFGVISYFIIVNCPFWMKQRHLQITYKRNCSYFGLHSNDTSPKRETQCLEQTSSAPFILKK